MWNDTTPNGDRMRLVADAAGWSGSGLFLVIVALVSTGTIAGDGLLSISGYLISATFLASYAIYLRDKKFIVVESTWAVIMAVALLKWAGAF